MFLSKFRCRAILMHFLLLICGKFTRAQLAHPICLVKSGPGTKLRAQNFEFRDSLRKFRLRMVESFVQQISSKNTSDGLLFSKQGSRIAVLFLDNNLNNFEIRGP
jgi:hypothetical protein